MEYGIAQLLMAIRYLIVPQFFYLIFQILIFIIYEYQKIDFKNYYLLGYLMKNLTFNKN